MDRETFRQKTLDGDERIRNTRIIWNHLSDEQKGMFLAGEKATADNDSVTNAFIDKCVNNFNAQQGEFSNEPLEPSDTDLMHLNVSRAAYARVVAYLLSAKRS